jgi:hypothetical protein
VAVSKQWNEHRREQRQSTLANTNDDSDDGFYTNEQMDELILRYEPPDARNRWDKPLYRVDMRPLSCQPQTTSGTTPGDGRSNNNQQQQHHQGLAKETLERSVYNMHDLSEAIHLQQETAIHTVAPPSKKATSMGGFKRAASTKVKSSQTNNNNNSNALATPAQGASESMANEALEDIAQTSSPSRLLSLEERVDAILDSFLNHVQPLQQSFSTQEQLASSDANLLQKVDMVTQLACQAIVAAQSKQQPGCVGGDGGKLAVHLQLQQQQPQQLHRQDGETQLWLNCSPRGVPLPWTELQRLRKQYMQWVKSQPPRDTTQLGIAQSFLQYIEASSSQE